MRIKKLSWQNDDDVGIMSVDEMPVDIIPCCQVMNLKVMKSVLAKGYVILIPSEDKFWLNFNLAK